MAESTEIKVKSTPGKVLLENYEEIRDFLNENLEIYRKWVVTPNTVSEARAALARVNKVAKAIDDQRIAVKKQIMEQYETEFKPACDLLVKMCKEVADNIGAQIDEIKAMDAPAKPKTTSVCFKVTGTKEELTALQKWLKENKLKVEKI